jgi:hypothetical protein
MPHNSMKICAAVLVLTAIIVGQAQAAGKGASGVAPGHQTATTPPPGDTGKSGFAPGDLKHDSATPLKNAKTLAPGQTK